MKVILTKGEFFAIYEEIQKLVNSSWPDDIYSLILKALLVRMHIKFYAKAIIVKPRYKLVLETEVALAFYECTSTIPYKYDSYEGNAVRRLNNLIHQQCIATSSISEALQII